jgi:hypothetical protein
MVIEAAPSTGYGKLRVIYDNNDNIRGSLDLNDPKSHRHNMSDISNSTLNQLGYPYSNYDHNHNASNPFLVSDNALPHSPTVPKLTPQKVSNPNVATFSTIPVGSDIGEDFWIQLSQTNAPATPHIQTNTRNQTYQGNQGPSKSSLPIPSTPLRGQGQENSMWYDPDELFLSDIKKYVTALDIQLFWEMARAIMELPKLSEHCHAIITNSMSLAALLKKTEYRFLFSENSTNILPRDAAIDLVAAAYVINS